MNGLDICAANIQNAYIQAPTSEKHYVICGPEFGEHQRKKALIRRVLYHLLTAPEPLARCDVKIHLTFLVLLLFVEKKAKYHAGQPRKF